MCVFVLFRLQHIFSLNLRYKIKELGTQHWNQPDLKAATSIHAVFIPSNSTHGIKNIGNNRLTYLTANQAFGKQKEEELWPEESVGIEEMITSFTINGAIANFLEDEIGSLEVGKKADLIVFNQNLFQIPATEIARTKVLWTFIDGKDVFSAAGE